MPGDVTTPHDALFKRVFTDIEQGGALLRQLLPPDLVAAVDWPSLRPVPTSLVPPELRELESVFSYLVIISREGEGLIEQVAQVLHPGAKRDAMDLVQQLQAKWKAEGKAEGVLDGRRETLRKQLALTFGALPEDAGNRVANATAEELDRWTERVLVANSLDDVLEA